MRRIPTRFTEKAETCGICLGYIEIRGELDCCEHHFCHSCVYKWSNVRNKQTENRCPICKARFYTIKRKGERIEYAMCKEEKVISIPHRSQQKDFSVLFSSVQTIIQDRIHEFVNSATTDSNTTDNRIIRIISYRFT